MHTGHPAVAPAVPWLGSLKPPAALPAQVPAGKPLKSVLNLTTTIDSLAFNHDGQMLVMASRLKRDALRCAGICARCWDRAAR